MNPQLKGVDSIPGTYIFDIRVSNRALKLNRFFWQMKNKDRRDRFNAEPEALMAEAGLTEEQKQLVRDRNWIGLIQAGAIFFALEKFARVAKVANLEVYAHMRGETFDAFMNTRRVPDAQ